MQGYVDMMMVLSPPDNIKELIHKYKGYAADVIVTYESMHAMAHISVKNLPRQKPYFTEPAVLALLKKLKSMPPIDLTVDGFDHFKHGEDFRTIYAKIRSDVQTLGWFKELKKHLNVKEYLVPHITIARNIPVVDFDKLWPHYKKIEWVETFNIGQLTVLHKEAFATFAKWEIYKEIPFEARHMIEREKSKPQAFDLRKGNIGANQQISLF